MTDEDKNRIRGRMLFMEKLGRAMERPDSPSNHNERLVMRWYLDDVEALLTDLEAREQSERLCKEMLLA